MADHVLLDTHVLLWWQAGSDRLSRRAFHAVEVSTTVLISPITWWEVAMLVAAERVRLDRPVATWGNDLLARSDIDVAPLSPSAAIAAAELDDFHGDPADRMIYATAAELDVPLVTKDTRMRAHAERHRLVRTLW